MRRPATDWSLCALWQIVLFTKSSTLNLEPPTPERLRKMNTHNAEQRNINLIYRLSGLRMTGSVLHLGAHPDDEDIGLLSYMTHKFGVRSVYWSATRGEGGQNRIGPYKAEALGVYRTWETLAARQIDGGEALYGPFFDFGYSKNAEESLNKWEHK